MLDSGKTTFGSAQASVIPDIVLYGAEVDKYHCYVVTDGTTVTLYPLALLTSVDGLRVSSPTVLCHSKFTLTYCYFVHNGSTVYAVIMCLSVCLSVCVYVTCWYCIKMAKLKIRQTTPHDSS